MLCEKTLLLAFITAIATWCPLAGAEASCEFDSELPATDVLIGYIGNSRQTIQSGTPEGRIRVGRFRVLGIIRSGAIYRTDGAEMREGMKLWNIHKSESPTTNLVNVSSFLDLLGKDHCVFHAEPSEDLPLWTILSSQPLSGEFDLPSVPEKNYFAQHQDICVDQGDPYPSKKPPCSRPKLLAVSDLDHDGAKEYWATEPYTWDTGITIWEQSPSGLKSMYKICTGCSD